MVVTALISLLSVAMLFRMSFNADVSSFALEGTEGGRAFLELQEKYDTAEFNDTFLEYATCMRENGFEEIPDRIDMVATTG